MWWPLGNSMFTLPTPLAAWISLLPNRISKVDLSGWYSANQCLWDVKWQVAPVSRTQVLLVLISASWKHMKASWGSSSKEQFDCMSVAAESSEYLLRPSSSSVLKSEREQQIAIHTEEREKKTRCSVESFRCIKMKCNTLFYNGLCECLLALRMCLLETGVHTIRA